MPFFLVIILFWLCHIPGIPRSVSLLFLTAIFFSVIIKTLKKGSNPPGLPFLFTLIFLISGLLSIESISDFGSIKGWLGNSFLPGFFLLSGIMAARQNKSIRKALFLLLSRVGLIASGLAVAGFTIYGLPGNRLLPLHLAPANAGFTLLASLICLLIARWDEKAFDLTDIVILFLSILTLFMLMSRTGLIFLIMLIPFILVFTKFSELSEGLIKKTRFCLLVVIFVPLVVTFFFQGLIMTGIRKSKILEPDMVKRTCKASAPIFLAGPRKSFKSIKLLDMDSAINSLVLSYAIKEKKYKKSIISHEGKEENIDLNALKNGMTFSGVADPVILDYEFKRPVELNNITLYYTGKATGKPCVRVLIDKRYEYLFRKSENRFGCQEMKLSFPIHKCSFLSIEFKGVYRSDIFSHPRYPSLEFGQPLRPAFDLYSRYFGRFRRVILDVFINKGPIFSFLGFGPGRSIDFYMKNKQIAQAFISEGLLPARHSHNFIMEWIIETGMWGYVSILLFIYMVVISIKAHIKAALIGNSGLFLLKIIGILLFLAFHVIDYITATPATACFAWLFLGLVLYDNK